MSTETRPVHKRFARHSWYRVRTIGTSLGSASPNRSDETIMTTTSTQLRNPAPAARHTPLADIDPYAASTARDTGRVTEAPDHRSSRPVTFNSAA